MTSINDVAKLAGVSVTTVSKVINNYPDVSSKTRNKVINIINELKYQPNVVARGLVKGRSWSVGIFLTTTFNNPFVAGVMSGIKKTLEDSGYDLIYLSQGKKDPDYNFVNHCQSRNVDGVVVFGFIRDDKNLQELIKAEIPTVFIDIDLLGKRAGYITSDNLTGIYLAVHHLYHLGHRKIAYISPKIGHYVAQVRYEGYKKALLQLSLSYADQYVQISEDMSFSEENGFLLMHRLLALPDPPTAVVCASDNLAVGAVQAIEENGLQVPKNFAITGFDDSFVCELMKPKITSVRQNIESIGEKALEILIAMIEDPNYSPNEYMMETELVVRESCGSGGGKNEKVV